MQIYEGEVIGLIGPNGGGKTTLLKLILGFLKPDRGTIKVFGHSPQAHPCGCHRLSYVPQNMRFDKEFPISVNEVVLSGLLSQLPWYGRFSGAQKKAALDALERVGLVRLSDSAFGTLSGGQAQRVLIARALVSDPKLLILDEPTASVDSNAEAEIYKLLRELENELTILMVTHDLQAAVEMVNRVFCVRRFMQELKPEEVCEHFAMGLYHKPLLPVKTDRFLNSSLLIGK